MSFILVLLFLSILNAAIAYKEDYGPTNILNALVAQLLFVEVMVLWVNSFF